MLVNIRKCSILFLILIHIFNFRGKSSKFVLLFLMCNSICAKIRSFRSVQLHQMVPQNFCRANFCFGLEQALYIFLAVTLNFMVNRLSCLLGENTLAYSSGVSVTKKKVFQLENLPHPTPRPQVPRVPQAPSKR